MPTTIRRSVDGVVTAITSSEEIEQAKPRPDIVLVALDKAGVSAQQAVFVGDTV
ncbi:HAD family hydrolase [Mycolicibacterium sp. CBM1]